MDVAWNTEAGVTDGDGKGCDQFQNNDSAAFFFSFPHLPGKTRYYPVEPMPAVSRRDIAEVMAQQRGQGWNILAVISYDFCRAS